MRVWWVFLIINVISGHINISLAWVSTWAPFLDQFISNCFHVVQYINMKHSGHATGMCFREQFRPCFTRTSWDVTLQKLNQKAMTGSTVVSGVCGWVRIHADLTTPPGHPDPQRQTGHLEWHILVPQTLSVNVTFVQFDWGSGLYKCRNNEVLIDNGFKQHMLCGKHPRWSEISKYNSFRFNAAVVSGLMGSVLFVFVVHDRNTADPVSNLKWHLLHLARGFSRNHKVVFDCFGDVKPSLHMRSWITGEQQYRYLAAVLQGYSIHVRFFPCSYSGLPEHTTRLVIFDGPHHSLPKLFQSTPGQEGDAFVRGTTHQALLVITVSVPTNTSSWNLHISPDRTPRRRMHLPPGSEKTINLSTKGCAGVKAVVQCGWVFVTPRYYLNLTVTKLEGELSDVDGCMYGGFVVTHGYFATLREGQIFLCNPKHIGSFTMLSYTHAISVSYFAYKGLFGRGDDTEMEFFVRETPCIGLFVDFICFSVDRYKEYSKFHSGREIPHYSPIIKPYQRGVLINLTVSERLLKQCAAVQYTEMYLLHWPYSEGDPACTLFIVQPYNYYKSSLMYHTRATANGKYECASTDQVTSFVNVFQGSGSEAKHKVKPITYLSEKGSPVWFHTYLGNDYRANFSTECTQYFQVFVTEECNFVKQSALSTTAIMHEPESIFFKSKIRWSCRDIYKINSEEGMYEARFEFRKLRPWEIQSERWNYKQVSLSYDRPCLQSCTIDEVFIMEPVIK